MAASFPTGPISHQGQEPERCCPRFGLPPAHFELSPYLFARIFFEAERQGYVGKQHKALHVVVLRRFLDRLSHLLQCPLDYAELDEKTKQATWISFKDMRMAFHRGYKPLVPLRPAEQLNMVLEDTNCVLGILFQSFILLIILVNCLLIAGLSFPEGTNACCTIIFTVEYLAKLACSPFTRRSLIKIEDTIEQAVPPMSDPNKALAWTSSKHSRVRNFVLEPMNVIDFLGILPFWTNLALGTMHVGHLEGLKVLRILRVLKISKYNRGFRLLGQVIAHSSHSFAAIAIYLGMLSMLFGPVISYFETESSFSDPPATHGHEQYVDQTEGGKAHLSFFWAASRFTSMQHSLRIKQAIPSHWVNQVLSRVIGLIKGFIFLTPLGEMQQSFKDLAAKQTATDALKVTVARQRGMTPDMDWLFEATTLSWGRIEVLGARDMDKVGLGYFNLPLGEIDEVGPVRQKVAISIRHRRARIPCSFGQPMVLLEVSWKPWTALGGGKTVPRGELEISLLEGVMFPYHVADTWRCRLFIPERLYQHKGTKVWLSDPSGGTPSKPEWHQKSLYEVDWQDEADRVRSSKSVKQEPPLTSLATRLQAGVRYLDALERRSTVAQAPGQEDNSSLQTAREGLE